MKFGNFSGLYITVLVGFGFTAFLSSSTFAGPTKEFSQNHAVRIVVRHPSGNPATSASGFLWQTNDQVITNLHAVRWPENITVTCKGITQRAKVEKVYPQGDLALLRVQPEFNDLTGRRDKPLSECRPFTALDKKEPGIDKKLYTWGWYSGAKTGVPRTQTMGVRSKLDDLLGTHKARPLLEAYGVPSLGHDVYNVEGGSLPGFSGSFVVDENSNLVAVIDGGLDEGQSSYNWIIPIEYLDVLMESKVSSVPDSVRNPPKILWSTADPDAGSDSVRAYRQVDDWDDNTIYDYQWYKTKTRTFNELVSTSADPGGLLSLMQAMRTEENSFAQLGDLLDFDIYEELDQGLIIATPVRQGLTYEEDSEFSWLVSEDDAQTGHSQYKQSQWPVSSSANPDHFVHPADDDYFDERISDILAECNKPGESTCSLDPSTLREVNFDNGNKILKVGFGVRWDDPSLSSAYDYYSIAVRRSKDRCNRADACEGILDQGVAFTAFLRIFKTGEAGPSACKDDPDRICANPTVTQLAQMIALDLTTFANIGLSRGGRVETVFDYNPIADHPETIHAGYFEDGDLRFYNSRGKIWLMYIPESIQTLQYTEHDRDAQFVYLRFGEDLATVPIDGGRYSLTSSGVRSTGEVEKRY